MIFIIRGSLSRVSQLSTEPVNFFVFILMKGQNYISILLSKLHLGFVLNLQRLRNCNIPFKTDGHNNVGSQIRFLILKDNPMYVERGVWPY